jgi:transposase-like protein
MLCSSCGSDHIVKNGHSSHSGKQQYKCVSCGHQFVENPHWRVIDDDTKALIGRCLLERLSLAAIARIAQVSESWLQAYVNNLYKKTPRTLSVKKNTSAD